LVRISDFAPDHVYYLCAVHGASSTGLNDDEALHDRRAFLDQVGLEAIIEALVKLKKDIGFFYAASSKIYGGYHGPVNEFTLFAPDCAYGRSKVRAIRYIESVMSSNIALATGILFHHHSLYRRGPYALTLLAKGIAHVNEPHRGDGLRDWEAVGDFSSAYEICRAMRRIVTRRLAGRYVLGSGTHKSLAELEYLTLELLGLPGEIRRVNRRTNRNSGVCVIADSVKLGRHNIEIKDRVIECLAEQVKWLRGHLD